MRKHLSSCQTVKGKKYKASFLLADQLAEREEQGLESDSLLISEVH